MKNIYFSTYKQVFELLTANQKKRFYLLQVLIVFTGFVDLAGLALFVPVISAISDRTLLEGDHFLATIKRWSSIQSDNDFLLGLFIGAVLFFIGRSVFVIFSQWVQTRFMHNLSEDIGIRTYAFYLNNEFEEIQARDSGRVVRELTISPQHYAKFLIMPLLLLTSEFLVLGILVLGIAWYNFSVFILLILSIVPVAFIFNRVSKKRVRVYGMVQNELTPQLLSSSTRGIYGIIDVRLRGKEKKLLAAYKKLIKELNTIAVKTSVLAVVPAKLFEVITIGGLLIIFIYGAFIAEDAQMIMPLIAIYAAAGYRLVPSLSKILPAFQSLEQYSYLFPVFRRALLAKETRFPIKTDLIPFEHEIKLEHIAFSYRGSQELILNDFNFKIRKGEVLGLIGKSGSGKTTLVNIIAGFLRPTSGQVRIDGIALNDENRSSWMRRISYVQQTPYIEKGTLVRNIAFLEDDIDLELLNKAIEMASLKELVGLQNPNDIMLEEHGKNLSGGQKQRVLIARALYHKASLIILDEATSALDNETEDDVNRTVKNLKGSGVTIIIIAHRYTTLKSTDRIIRLDHGSIDEETSYTHLKTT